MNDKLKQAEELEAKLVERIGQYRQCLCSSNFVLDEIRNIMSLISQLVEENERLNSILELHAYVLTKKREKTLDKLTALSQEMGEYE